jgi:hypothetical protein
MNYTKCEQTHAIEDCANRSHKKIGINWFYCIKFNRVDLFETDFLICNL